jgi:uncharacterized protein YeaO (DUF488 family)
MKFRTVQLGSPRKHGEGLRIGAVRYLPRGVRREDYARLDYFDVWLPTLAPSRDLLSQLKRGEVATERFLDRYRREMNATEPRQVIALLACLAERTSLSVGCYCESEERCHRSVLASLIRTVVAERSANGAPPRTRRTP